MLVKPCIVIPVYNHGKTLREVVERALVYALPIFVVDDGSTDAGPQQLSDLPVTVITQPYNQGKGKALLAGARAARQSGQAFTHMISLDADAQHYPEDIPLFMKAMEQDPRAIIIGNRDFSAAHIPKSSRFGRVFSGFWMWVQTGQRVSDMQSGYRAYPLSLFDTLTTQESGYAFEVEVLVRAAWAHIPIKGIAVQVLYQGAEERVSHFHALRDNMRMTWLNTKLTTRAVFWHAARALSFACATKAPGHANSASEKKVWSSRSLGSRAQHEIFRFMVRYKAFFVAQMVLQGVVFYYTLWPSVRRRARPYIERRFGKAQSERQKFLHTWRLFGQFGQVLLCRMLHTESQKESLKPTEKAFQEHMQSILARGKGCIIVGAHVGGWQSGLAALERWQVPISVLLWRDPKDVDKHYFEKQPQGAKSQVRAINAAEPLAAMVAVHAALKANEIVVLMGDRRMDEAALQGAEPCVTVPFLGENILLPIKAYALASKTGAPLVVQFTVQEGLYTRLYCSREIKVAANLNHRKPEVFAPYALQYTQELEKFVVENPYQFFNFYNVWLDKI